MFVQYRRVLTFAQPGEERDLPVGELQSVVMRVWLLRLDLPESSHLIHDEFLTPEDLKKMIALHCPLERDLRAGTKTHGHMRFSDGSETTRERVIELRRHQLVSDLRRSGCDEMQTVVTD